MGNVAHATAASLAARVLGTGIIAQLTADGEHGLSFDYLGVPQNLRGQGLADQAIAAVCVHADAHHLTITMQPNSGFGSDLRRLTPWYGRHGFVPVAGATPFTMRRVPERLLPRMGTETDLRPILETLL